MMGVSSATASCERHLYSSRTCTVDSLVWQIASLDLPDPCSAYTG